MNATIRFLREYIRPRSRGVEVVETTYVRDGGELPARLYRPAGVARPLPTWIVLHGLTWHGRGHPSLDRFARAVAAGGSAVFVPEIPEWSRLRVAPGVTGPTLLAAADAVLGGRIALAGRIAALGFSFGATQALAAASTAPALAGRLRAIAAWGGYCDLRNVFRFGFTGEYEYGGVRYTARPDPYGGWIMGANYLTRIPGLEDHEDVASALARLAEESGRRGVYAADAVYDPYKRELRAALPAGRRPVFDAFAPPAGERPPDPELAGWLTDALAAAAVRADPLLDPGPRLARLGVRTLLAHGRDDRLVPFTETLRLGEAIPRAYRHGMTITALFAHSGRTARPRGPIGLGREAVRFIGLLHRLLALPAAR